MLEWGRHLDRRTIARPTSRTELIGYIAKHATKGTGTAETADRPIRDIEHLQYLDVSRHHAQMIRTC